MSSIPVQKGHYWAPRKYESRSIELEAHAFDDVLQGHASQHICFCKAMLFTPLYLSSITCMRTSGAVPHVLPAFCALAGTVQVPITYGERCGLLVDSLTTPPLYHIWRHRHSEHGIYLENKSHISFDDMQVRKHDGKHVADPPSARPYRAHTSITPSRQITMARRCNWLPRYVAQKSVTFCCNVSTGLAL